MLATYKDMFIYFLDGIKKTYTGTVHPNIFVRLFNDRGLIEWTADNMSIKEGIELTQKQIDDLQTLLEKEEVRRPHLTNNTLDLTKLNKRYRRLANIMVKVNYEAKKCQECDRTGVSKWRQAFTRRTNQIVYFRRSVYRRPSSEKIYYQQVGNEIQFDSGGDVDVVAVKMEYFRYPDKMEFMDVSNPSRWNVLTYEDLNPEQKKEVLDKCVTIYVERVKDERYRTILYEEQKKNITNF